MVRRISLGWPRLRTLRAVAEEISRPFDRRCPPRQPARKRANVRRFKRRGPIFQTLQSPNLERALRPGRQPAGFDLQRSGTV
jgi:hypothetical protein